MLRLWDLRIEVLLPLLLAAALYLRGWSRVRRGGHARLASGWRLAAYLGGLATLGAALMSPIDTLGGYSLTIHMVQHLLLAMIAPPLLLLANPLPFALWGLPDGVRRALGGTLRREGAVRRLLQTATGPGIAWLVLVIVVVAWHDPAAYGLALRSDLVHGLEHLSFVAASMLFWWLVVGAGPRVHGSFSPGRRVALLLFTVPLTMGLGIAIAFAEHPLYIEYLTAPRVLGLSVMDDQRLGGVIMWTLGSMMFFAAALALIARLVQDEAEKPPQSLDTLLRNPSPSRST